MHPGDMLVIVSLDRLGRNYNEIRKQWELITKTLNADIKVLDMPLLDTSKSNNSLEGKFIADIVLQILSYTAEKERENIRKRQRQGIDTAKAQGKQLGRPKAEYPDRWVQVYDEWKSGNMTATKAIETLNMKRTTFYKLVKQYESDEK